MTLSAIERPGRVTRRHDVRRVDIDHERGMSRMVGDEYVF